MMPVTAITSTGTPSTRSRIASGPYGKGEPGGVDSA